MSRGTLTALLSLAALTLAAGCKGPTVASPLANQVRYTCCNMRYERDAISDVNYQVGSMIPFGTRVQILEVGRNSVKFQATGHPPITLTLKYGKSALSMDQYLERVFLVDDPHDKLRKTPEKTRKLIDQGAVEAGMTRDQVLTSLGYPPAHRTASLESPVWTYWQNRWVTMQVYFDGDKVSRVQR